MFFNTIYANYQPLSGDIIKIDDTTKPALYYINSQSQRQLYPNAVTFWTWNSGDWNNIKNFNGNKVTIKYISQTDFDRLASGDNVVVRAGTKLIKFGNSYNIYAVADNGVINKVASNGDTSVAVKLYGDNFHNNIISIQSGFESNYTEGQSLMTTNSTVTPPATNILNCTSDQHLDNGSCISNSRLCNISNGSGSQAWISTGWGQCYATSCNSGYSITESPSTGYGICTVNPAPAISTAEILLSEEMSIYGNPWNVGRYVVWEGYDYNIYYKDLTSGKLIPLTTDGKFKVFFGVAGYNSSFYRMGRNLYLNYFNGYMGSEMIIDSAAVGTYSGIVEGYPTNNSFIYTKERTDVVDTYDIFIYSITDNGKIQLTNSAAKRSNPVLSLNMAAWVENSYQIVIFDRNSKVEIKRINNQSGNPISNLVLSDSINYLAYSDGQYIYYYDIDNGITKIIGTTLPISLISVSSPYIVWSNGEILAYNILNGQTITVSQSTTNNKNPSIVNKGYAGGGYIKYNVVWTSTISPGNNKVYLGEIHKY